MRSRDVVEENEDLVPLAKLALGNKHASPEAQRALALIILKNTPICIQAARRMQRAARTLTVEDLVAAGQEGLHQAVRMWTSAGGAKFLTYAVWWVRALIGTAVANDATGFAGASKFKHFLRSAKFTRARLALEAKGLSVEDVRHQLAERFAITPEIVCVIETLARPMISFDAPISSDGDGSLHDVLPSMGLPSDAAFAQREFAARMRATLDQMRLSERERLILNGRLLVSDERDALTLDDIGARFGVCKERVRQLEVMLIKKLRTTLGPLRAEIRDRRHPPPLAEMPRAELVQVGDMIGRFRVVDVLEQTAGGNVRVRVHCTMCLKDKLGYVAVLRRGERCGSCTRILRAQNAAEIAATRAARKTLGKRREAGEGREG